MKYSIDLDYYLDKACTLIVQDINWHYKVEAMMDYFVGLIYRIDEKYIWLKHPKTKTLTCIDLNSVIAISEEQILYEKNPAHKQIIDEYRNKNPEVADKTSIKEEKQQQFIDIKNLNSLIKKNK